MLSGRVLSRPSRLGGSEEKMDVGGWGEREKKEGERRKERLEWMAKVRNFR